MTARLFADPDHDQFASGPPLKTGPPPRTSPVTGSGSGTPQSASKCGTRLSRRANAEAFATDLKGNVIWTYTYQGTGVDHLQGIQLLPNGDLLMVISYLSSLPPQGSGTVNAVREVDLAGNTVREIDMSALNQKLSAAGYRDSDGDAYQLTSFHHSVLALPNGHWVLLAAYPKTFTNLPGYPGKLSVLGDVLVEWIRIPKPDYGCGAPLTTRRNRHPMSFSRLDSLQRHGLLQRRSQSATSC